MQDPALASAGQQEQDNSEGTKRVTTKKKKEEFNLPITARVSGLTKPELDRLIEQEVIPFY